TRGYSPFLRPSWRRCSPANCGATSTELSQPTCTVARSTPISIPPSPDGSSLTGLPLEHLRREVALVTQEHHIFRGALRDNIVLAREDAGDEEVREALVAVGAGAWVCQLPAGLDTVIGSGALQVSPGQAQQIVLARLLLADPHTLVLDEATSLIDPATARNVGTTMSALIEGENDRGDRAPVAYRSRRRSDRRHRPGAV